MIYSVKNALHTLLITVVTWVHLAN